MTAEEFKKLRLAQLEIMDEIHVICTKNNICYYIIGGTALGARRHGGFIPWDLDIDIAMRRKDYDAFKQACEFCLDKRFLYRDHLNTKNFSRPHALVCIKNTYLSTRSSSFNPKEENYGIYLDVFPLDNAPQEERLQERQMKRLERIKKQKIFKRAYLYSNNALKKAIKNIIKTLLFWTSIDKLNAEFAAAARQYDDHDTGLLCSMSSHYSYRKQCMPSGIYGKPTLVKFEDREFYAPERLDDYLSRIYGDFMKPPSEQEKNKNMSAFEKVIFARA